MVDPFYSRKSDREDSLMSKAMDLPLRSSIGHPSAFPLDSPSKQHSSLEESIDNAVSAHTPTMNPISVALHDPVGIPAMVSSPLVGVPPLEDVSGQSGLGQSVMDSSQPKRLHVSNIPFRYRENDLRALFAVSAHLRTCGVVGRSVVAVGLYSQEAVVGRIACALLAVTMTDSDVRTCVAVDCLNVYTVYGLRTVVANLATLAL